ncbi:glutamyl-tRNA reductase [Serinibacter salmoneus]|uniref:Glutamyl-tRNA reductase n=1 Tax=Serinibacter salmoneus TaxID=556530 RepID=A0A2A9CZZ3_9MICO|nr:glutamyl-tRNA reductase [Serinibacter salmoneus]PFG19696.1 glutamyl-tRNA reductase [Serinibacter salmoneus]
MLLALSMTHATAGFATLESATAAVSGMLVPEVLKRTLAHDHIDGAVLLTTCNRLEAYLDIHPDRERDVTTAVLGALAARVGEPVETIRDAVAVRRRDEAATHLFTVTSGLDSLVRGEGEIAGQVRRDYDLAREAGHTTPDLDAVFQRAQRVSREVRSAAGPVGGGEASVTQLALELASGHVEDLRSAQVLLIGTGAHARTAVVALAGRGVRDVAVYSAAGRAERFALRHGVRAVPDLGPALAEADIVLTCTSRTAIAASDLPDRTRGRLLVIDLGLPRNVDPHVADLPGVDLLDLDTIGKHAQVPGLRTDEVSATLIHDAVADLSADQDAAATVVALRRHVGDILDAEIMRARRRAQDVEEADRTEAALRHLAGVLQHGPTIRARQAAAQGTLAEFDSALDRVLGVRGAPVTP